MKRGGEFEQLIERQLAVMPGHTIDRVDPPVRVFSMKTTGKSHSFTGAFSASGKLDFAGGWERRYVEFDAKDVKGHRLPFSKIRDAQWLRLKKLVENGDAAGVLVRFRGKTANHDILWGVHGYLLLRMRAAGAKSITTQDCGNVSGDLTVLVRLFKVEDLRAWFRVLAGKKV